VTKHLSSFEDMVSWCGDCVR